MRAKLVLLSGFLLILFIPSQLGLHFWPSWAIPGGLRIDYLSPTLLFTDILCFIFIIFAKPQTSNLKHLYLISIFNLLLSKHPQIVLFHWFRIYLYYFVFQSLKKYLPLFKKYWLISLSLSVLWTSSLAVMQFISGKSLDGFWYWLGERPLSLVTPYVSKVYFEGFGYFLRPYATFPHPNALAGYLLVSLITIFNNKKTFLLDIGHWSLVIGTAALLLTFSKTILFPLAFLVSSSDLRTTFYERQELFQKSLEIFKTYPLTGVGLGASPAIALSELSESKGSNLQLSYQPVHNIFMLLLVELGLPLFLIFIHFFIKSFRHLLAIGHWSLVIALTLTSAMDHYWLTSPSNLLLLAFVFALESTDVHKTNYSQ